MKIICTLTHTISIVYPKCKLFCQVKVQSFPDADRCGSSSAIVAISWRCLLMTVDPARDRQGCGVTHDEEPKDDEQNIGNSLPCSGGNHAVVHERLFGGQYKYNYRLEIMGELTG